MKILFLTLCFFGVSCICIADPVPTNKPSVSRSKGKDLAPLKFELLKGYKKSPPAFDKVNRAEGSGGTSLPNQGKSDSKRKLFSEGTGTRGGGSGVLNQNGSVSLWDMYRSQHLDQFPQYFTVSPELLKTNQELDAAAAADAIYNKVLARIRTALPVLAAGIDQASEQIPFANWVASADTLPLIDDYGQEDVQIDGAPVQIAYRRTKQVIYDEDLYAAMDGLNRAALRMHEYIYASSGAMTSEAVQQLVSLLFSDQILSPDAFGILKARFAQFKMLSLMITSLDLPQGSVQTEELARPEEVCGFIDTMELNGSDFFLKLDVAVDHYRLDSKDLALEVMETLNFSKRLDKHLKLKDAMQVLSAFYQARMHLNFQFPIFLYPAQSTAKDIVCLNSKTGRIASIEATLVYNKKKNDAELENAGLEASYFREHRSYLQDPSRTNYISFLRSELALERSNLNPINVDEMAILYINDVENLGHFKVRLEK